MATKEAESPCRPNTCLHGARAQAGERHAPGPPAPPAPPRKKAPRAIFALVEAYVLKNLSLEKNYICYYFSIMC